MRFAAVNTRASLGMEAPQVRVEAHITGGLAAFGMVGLPETAVRESRDRVRAALLSSGFRFPDARLTVNLAPADLPKGGGRFDLAIALAVLGASGQITTEGLDHYEFVAELGLEGGLRPVKGTLLAALAAARCGHPLVVAPGNAMEAALVPDGRILPARSLLDVTTHLAGVRELAVQPRSHAETEPEPEPGSIPSLDQVRGHEAPKRALTVAAAGGHNLLMQGPPGTGKTLLARCLAGLLPPLTDAEALEVAAMHSLAGHLPAGRLPGRPFRAPHHSASAAALVGGGSQPQPGEMSLAHHGVLFLDELPEFPRNVLENLREPLESGMVAIARARARAVFPARFQLVAAMNPCPAGLDCRGGVSCQCPPNAMQRYQSRISAPLLDRIDLYVDVPAVPIDVLARSGHEQTISATSSETRARAAIRAARERALQRQGVLNAGLDAPATERLCQPDAEGLALLEKAAERMALSARSWHRTLRVARTLADLNEQPGIRRAEIAEALVYRHRGTPETR